MQICTRNLARIPDMSKAVRKDDWFLRAILREFFRRSRQEYRRGPAYERFGRKFRSKPQSSYVLPLVGVETIHGQGSHMAPPKLDGYGSNYRPWESRPMSSTPLDLV